MNSYIHRMLITLVIAALTLGVAVATAINHYDHPADHSVASPQPVEEPTAQPLPGRAVL